MLQLRSGATSWVAGSYLTVVGIILLIATHQAYLPRYAPGAMPLWLNPILVGGGCALMGSTLLTVRILGPRFWIGAAASVGAGLGLALVALSYAAAGRWLFASFAGTLALVTLVSPWLDVAPEGITDRRIVDLFALAMGLCAVVTGVRMAISASEFDDPVYQVTRFALPWLGVALSFGGLAVLVHQFRPIGAKAPALAGHMIVGGGFLVLSLVVFWPAQAWLPVVSLGGLGIAVATLPWLGPWLLRVDTESLRTRVAATLLLVVAALFVFTAMVDTQSSSDALQGQSLMAQQTLATSISQSVAGAMARHRAVVESLTADPATFQQSPQSQGRWLDAVVRATGGQDHLATYAADGAPLARSDGQPLRAWPNELPRDAVAGRPTATMVVRQAPGTPPSAVIAAPVHRTDGALVGFVAADVDLTSLAMLLPPASQAPGDATYVVGDDGRILQHPTAGIVADHADFSRVPSVQAALHGAPAGSLTYPSSYGDILAGYARIPGTTWAVVVERPFFNAYATLEPVKNRSFWLLIVIMVAAIGVGCALAHKVSSPLRILAVALDDLAEGDDTAPLPASRLTEVARLAGAFAAMRGHLAERTLERARAEADVRAMNETLERRVGERTAELATQLAEAERARTEARAVLDAASDAMMWMSPDLHILAINRPFAEMYRVRRWDDLVGQPRSRLGDLARRCLADPDEVLAAFGAWHADPDGCFTRDVEQVWPVARQLEVTSNPVPGVGRLFVYRDVTLERAVDQLKSEFVSLVSHELRTPLTSIKGYLELVLAGEVGPVSPQQREFLGIIDSNADRLVTLINDLLDLSRLESGKLELHPATVDMARLLEEVVTALRPQIAQKRQSLLLDLPPTPLLLWADHDRLTQVVTNLLSNAHKYTKEGGQISCTATTDAGMARLAVGDTGIGMTPEEQAQLFTRFFRARNRTTQEVGGTGLGLTIVKALVELHGGTIGVTSTPGEGSTFTVTLPLSQLADVPPVAPRAPEPVSLVPAHGKILVVEDELQIAHLLERFLARGGYEVVIAHDGARGLQLAEIERPDLIALDLVLPDTDGFTVLDQLKRNTTTAAIPVLIISSMPDDGRGDRMGAVGYFTKPVLEDRLLQQVGRILAGDLAPLVVVADEDAEERRRLTVQLGRAGYRVREATSGAEAVDVARLEAPGLVLLALGASRLENLAALRALRKDAATSMVPVVVMVADQGAPEALHSMADVWRSCALLSTSFTAEELAGAIARSLTVRPAHSDSVRPDTVGTSLVGSRT